MNACYIANNFPYKDNQINYIELIGEIIIHTVIWSNVGFQRHLTQRGRTILGSVQIFFIVLAMFVNISYHLANLPKFIKNKFISL